MSPGAGAGAGRFTPLLLLLFAGSGCAALIYEVVWFHLLRLVVGSSALSLGFLLGSFMGGMCLGSLLLPRLLSARRHPLRVYAGLELGIGAIGLALPVVLPHLGALYTENVGYGIVGFVLRGTVCAIALLPPTMLMGATLPAIARWLDSSRSGVADLGRFYAANIVGAVVGTLLAGFYLLRVHDIVVATWFAAAVNGLVAVVALLLAGRRRFAGIAAAATADASLVRRPSVYVAIAVSGFTALAAEVVWTRLLSLLFGASVYTFSLILAVFLTGLGLGSSLGARAARRSERPRLAFGLCQLLLVPAILYAAFMIVAVIPFGEPTLVFQRVVYERMGWRYSWDFVRCALAILPATVLWGASFPLALAAAGSARDPGRLVGGMYAANTVGAIAGALLASAVLIAVIGTQRTQQLLAALAGATALAMIVVDGMASPRRVWRTAVAAVAIVAAVPMLTVLVPRTPDGLIGYGRACDEWDVGDHYLFAAEGINASVAVTEFDGQRSFHVSGKVVASTQSIDMRLQRMLGHLPSLIHDAPRSVLIVGCGAGVTAGCFTEYRGIERIVICEIEPRVIEGARRFLANENRDVIDDPRTEVVIDDARHFLATTRERFDIITSDPIHPWVRGAAALYSAEYHELVKAHLNPGGIVTQWVPLYETDEASVKSQVGTFVQAFPQATFWNSDIEEKGYDIVMMARVGPLRIDVDAIEARLAENSAVRRALDEVQIGSTVLLLMTYFAQGRDLQQWLADAQINLDVSLRLQYLAGAALDFVSDQQIYAAMRSRFSYPENVFMASERLDGELRVALRK